MTGIPLLLSLVNKNEYWEKDIKISFIIHLCIWSSPKRYFFYSCKNEKTEIKEIPSWKEPHAWICLLMLLSNTRKTVWTPPVKESSFLPEKPILNWVALIIRQDMESLFAVSTAHQPDSSDCLTSPVWAVMFLSTSSLCLINHLPPVSIISNPLPTL